MVFILERDGKRERRKGGTDSGATTGIREAVFLYDKDFAEAAEKSPDLLTDEMMEYIYKDDVDNKEDALQRLKDDNEGKGVKIALHKANEILIPALIKAIKEKKVNPSEPYAIDNWILEYEESHEGGKKDIKALFSGNNSASLSASAANLGAFLNGVELYEFLAGKKDKVKPEDFDSVVPLVQLIAGGRHGGNVEWQEFSCVPMGKTYAERLEKFRKISSALRDILKEEGIDKGMAGDGAFLADIKDNIQGIKLIIEAGERVGYIPGKDFSIGLDLNASQYYRKYIDGDYYYFYKASESMKSLNSNKGLGEFKSIEGEMYLLLTPDEHLKYILDLCQTKELYLSLLEDPFEQNDYKNHRELTRILESKKFKDNLPHEFQKKQGIIHVADRMTASDPDTIKAAIKGEDVVFTIQGKDETIKLSKNTINGTVLKLTQAGTIKEVMEAAELLIKSNKPVVISQRANQYRGSSELLAHIAQALTASRSRKGDKPLIFVKAGDYRGIRAGCHDKLLEIEEQIEKTKVRL
jgi:enolase